MSAAKPRKLVDAWVLPGGQIVQHVHRRTKCQGEDRPCLIHRPSKHHMRDWPMNWRDDRCMMERICPCGVGHPDPDEICEDTVHGCCGCCTPEGAEANRIRREQERKAEWMALSAKDQERQRQIDEDNRLVDAAVQAMRIDAGMRRAMRR